MREPTLHTERLCVSLPTLSDAPALQRYTARNLDFHRPWSPTPPPDAATLGSALERIQTIRRDFESGRSVRLWLKLNTAPEEFVGAVALTEIALGPLRQCYLGYHLDQRHQGCGLMTEAVRATVDYAFDELRLHRICANYMPSNERSGALLARAGFVVEGYAQRYLLIDGRFRDHVLTALTNPRSAELEAAQARD